MSQFDFGNLESPLPGSVLINDNLEPWRDALHSLHSGPSRPPYAIPGMAWVNNTTNPWVLNMFTGSADIPIGYFDTSTGTFTPAGVSQSAADISYDNSGSGLSSDNVQDAIDEAYGDYDSFASRVSGFATAAQGALADTALQPSVAERKVSTINVTAVSVIDITSILRPGYDYTITLDGVAPATNGGALSAQVSTNNGTSFDAGSTSYRDASTIISDASSSVLVQNSTGNNRWRLTDGGDSTLGGLGASGDIVLYNPAGTSIARKARWDIEYDGIGGVYSVTKISGAGRYNTSSAFNAIRFLMGGGFQAKGRITIWEKPI